MAELGNNRLVQLLDILYNDRPNLVIFSVQSPLCYGVPVDRKALCGADTENSEG